MRTSARETLFKLVFASQFTKDIEDGFKRALFSSEKLSENDRIYCETELKIINEHCEEFAQLIDKHSRLFPEARLFPADRSVLFIALAEILYSEDIPDAVAANEAANIASKYSSERSASFVNGILAEIIREKRGV